jgi:hypothetical protein
MALVMSTVLSRLNAFLDSRLGSAPDGQRAEPFEILPLRGDGGFPPRFFCS